MKPKEDIIKLFVLNNYKFLTDNTVFNDKEYIQLKNNYFAKELKHKYGNPRDKEISNILVEILIKNLKITSIEELDIGIQNIPLLRMNNIDANNYIGIISSVNKKYEIGDKMKYLKGIEQVEILTEIIKKEKKEEIDIEISKKMDEYRRVPSILDDIIVEEPNVEEKTEETQEWWKILNLRENPFPDLQGLFSINKELYDEIIVTTKPIEWLQMQLDKKKIEIFKKAFLLPGNLGTGKTTLFDYLSPYMTIRHIEPIRIALVDSISEAHYMQNYQKQLFRNLTKISRKYAINLKDRIMDAEESMITMLELQGKGVKGFLIFLDDLHKHQNSKMIFNFLSGLQIEKDNFAREGINVIFLVSGFPDWIEIVKSDSALAGFIDDPSTLLLPEVTPELAAEVVRKRLKAFSINTNKEINIQDKYFHIIFDKVDSKIKYASKGFRLYIEEILRHFERGEFDILTIDFTRLNEELTGQIKVYLENNNDFKNSINKLIYSGGIKKKEIRELTLKILCEIYLRNGISEEDEILKKYSFSFKQLNDCRFIQKYNRSGSLYWKIPPFLNELNIKIIKEFNLSLEDYLVQIYCEPTQKIKKVVESGEKIISKYREELKIWEEQSIIENDILKLLTKSIEIYEEYICPIMEIKDSKKLSDSVLQESSIIEECIWLMMKSLFLLESPSILNICNESSCWILRHRKLEYSHQFLQMIKESEGKISDKSDIARLIAFSNDTFVELWEEFRKCMKITQTCGISIYKLPVDIINTLYREYDRLIIGASAPDLFDSLQTFTKRIEQFLRKYLHVSSFLIFGPYHRRTKYYPESILKYMGKSQIGALISYESYNEYESLNRGQYRFLFTQIGKKEEYYRFIIEPIIKYWDSQDISSFFSIFGDINQVTSHLKSSFTEKYKKEIPSFVRQSCRFLATLCERLQELLTTSSYNLVKDENNYVGFGYQYLSDKDIDKIPDCICQYDVSELIKKEYEDKIYSQIDNIFNGVQIDITDIDSVRITFNTEYVKIIPFIRYLSSKGKINILFSYGDRIFLKVLD